MEDSEYEENQRFLGGQKTVSVHKNNSISHHRNDTSAENETQSIFHITDFMGTPKKVRYRESPLYRKQEIYIQSMKVYKPRLRIITDSIRNTKRIFI